MEKLKEERIKEIDERIAGLKEHATMWAKAGGRGGMMAMDARAEVKELELEREDLINGTNKLAIYKIEKELERLTYLRRDANVFQRVVYNSRIKKLEKELYSLKEKDRNIKVSSESLEAENNELSKLNSDNVVDGVKYVITGKISPPIDPDLWKLREEEPKYDFSNFDNDDLDNLDETVTYEEKGRSR